ncbi:MAG: sugar ABC transporter ATP-binding protein [Gaiellaceae bacterium]
MAVAPLLEVRGLSKAFGGSEALDRVDFDLRPNEIHALLGENGAGKSTLVKILAGVHRPDEGEIRFQGHSVHASALPMSFVHQELGLADAMSVAENIALVSGYRRRAGLIRWKDVSRRAEDVLRVMGADIDPQRNVLLLTAADKSLVAIARGLAVDARLFSLDEPTAALPESDVARLFDVLRRLRENGIGMIYVTHRLDEVFRLADRVTILRDGRKVATLDVAETTPAELIYLIVGRRLSEVIPAPSGKRGTAILELEDAVVGSAGPVSFSLHEGEILGLVGLRGGGHDTIGRMLCGDARLAQGSARLVGKEIGRCGVHESMRRGIAFITSKRAEEGLAPTLVVRENVFLNPAARSGTPLRVIPRRRERHRAVEVLERFDIRPRQPERVVATLSGGNQQKVLLARAMELDTKLLVLEEPTFGVDVGARAEIYLKLAQSAQEGLAAVVVSSDFKEVAGICDRAIVFNRGRAVAEVPRGELSAARLTQLATGAAAESAAIHAATSGSPEAPA